MTASFSKKEGDFEFEPFKFTREKQQLYHGYTVEELYGKRYGLNHSPMVRKEMSKDNVMVIVAILAGMVMCGLSREHDKTLEKDWKTYIAHDYDDNYRSLPK